MKDVSTSLGATSSGLMVPATKDIAGEHRGLGVSEILFKVMPEQSGGLLILENVFHQKGGPPRHVHHEQDEWFYALEGEFIIEVGDERFEVKPGDSVLAPRKIPHVWAFSGEGKGRMLVTFNPAGQMEAFFREVTKTNAMPKQDPALWSAYGMQVLGPPLEV